MQNSQNNKKVWKARQPAAFWLRRGCAAATTNEKFWMFCDKNELR